jgi:hypothetical protein
VHFVIPLHHRHRLFGTSPAKNATWGKHIGKGWNKGLEKKRRADAWISVRIFPTAKWDGSIMACKIANQSAFRSNSPRVGQIWVEEKSKVHVYWARRKERVWNEIGRSRARHHLICTVFFTVIKSDILSFIAMNWSVESYFENTYKERQLEWEPSSQPSA